MTERRRSRTNRGSRTTPRRKAQHEPRKGPPLEGERVQKVMAQLGVASRRASEVLIRDGEVTINGRLAKLGDRVTEGDAIKVRNRLLRPQQAPAKLYLALHKPESTMTTRSDPEGRTTVFDLVPNRYHRGLMSVGRLDYGTEGLLLLTTDGDFAQRVAHPKHGCIKTYLVKVKGVPDERTIARLSGGIRLDGVKLRPAVITAHRVGGHVRVARKNSWWKVEIGEGRTRQVRRMFEHCGHLVTRLKRIQVGSVRLGSLAKGDVRELNPHEVEALQAQSTPK